MASAMLRSRSSSNFSVSGAGYILNWKLRLIEVVRVFAESWMTGPQGWIPAVKSPGKLFSTGK